MDPVTTAAIATVDSLEEDLVDALDWCRSAIQSLTAAEVLSFVLYFDNQLRGKYGPAWHRRHEAIAHLGVRHTPARPWDHIRVIAGSRAVVSHIRVGHGFPAGDMTVEQALAAHRAVHHLVDQP